MHIRSAEILCVGTEILIGDIVNTNAAYLSARLAAMGIDQYYQSVVGDNPARLEDCIRAALRRCDLLIMTGGLGPPAAWDARCTCTSIPGSAFARISAAGAFP